MNDSRINCGPPNEIVEQSRRPHARQMKRSDDSVGAARSGKRESGRRAEYGKSQRGRASSTQGPFFGISYA